MVNLRQLIERRLPTDRAADNRLSYDDELFVRARRALGIPVVNQCVWRLPVPVDAADLARLHAAFVGGRLHRIVTTSRVPGARPRWVHGGHIAPLVIDEMVDEDYVMEWIDARANRSLDPFEGPVWELSAAPTSSGGTVLSMVVCHEIADGVGGMFAMLEGLGGAKAATIPGPEGAVNWLDDLRDTGHQLRGALAGLVHRDDPATLPPPTPPAVPRVGAVRPRTTWEGPPTAIVACPAEEWHATAARHGGTANSLFIGLSADLLLESGRLGPGQRLKIGLPVSQRGGNDLRSNATTGVSIVIDLADPADGPPVELSQVRGEARQAFAALSAGRRVDPLERWEPLIQLLPDVAVRRFAGSQPAPLCLASNLGGPPRSFIDPFGTGAGPMVLRAVTQGVTEERLRERRGGISTWWSESAGTVSVAFAALDPDAWPDRATLLADITAVYDRWGLEATPW